MIVAVPGPPHLVTQRRRTATLFVKCIAFAGTAALLLQRDQAFNHWGRPKRSPSKVSLCTFRCLPSETPNISPAEWEAAKAAEQRRAGLRAQTKGDSWGGGTDGHSAEHRRAVDWCQLLLEHPPSEP